MPAHRGLNRRATRKQFCTLEMVVHVVHRRTDCAEPGTSTGTFDGAVRAVLTFETHLNTVGLAALEPLAQVRIAGDIEETARDSEPTELGEQIAGLAGFEHRL